MRSVPHAACVLQLRLSIHKAKLVYAIACKMNDFNTNPAPLRIYHQDVSLLLIVCLILKACMLNVGPHKAMHMVDERSFEGSLGFRVLAHLW